MKSSAAESLAASAIRQHQDDILAWLAALKKQTLLPFYASVDVRDSGQKMSVVDTNLFPAGFNNLCPDFLDRHRDHLKEMMENRIQDGKHVMLVTEEHTRNPWYFENVDVLKDFITSVGYDVCLASFISPEPGHKHITVETASGKTLKIRTLNEELNHTNIDMILLNHDLTTGIPKTLQALEGAQIPIYPSPNVGWHQRRKSDHFKSTNRLLSELSNICDIDPWLLSCQFSLVEDIDIYDESHTQKLADSASDLFKRIAKKYSEYTISDKPYIFIKADAGTYGMGIHPIGDPNDILSFNRKIKNKLNKGKSKQTNTAFLLQEGIESNLKIDEHPAEMTIYYLEHQPLGSFYRYNTEKDSRQNLNSRGMGFRRICPEPNQCDCGNKFDAVPIQDNPYWDVYYCLGQLSVISAGRELEDVN